MKDSLLVGVAIGLAGVLACKVSYKKGFKAGGNCAVDMCTMLAKTAVDAQEAAIKKAKES